MPHSSTLVVLGRRRFAVAVTTALSCISAASLAPTARADVAPGRNLELNESINMGVLEGYNGPVLVEVLRGGVLIASHEAETTGATYDINHVGGDDCWSVDGGAPNAQTTTPDVQPGDKIVATVLDPVTRARTSDSDYNFVRNVRFEEAGGTISGTAHGVETAGAFDVTAPITISGAEEGAELLMEAKRVGGTVDADVVLNPTDGNFSSPLEGSGGEVFIDTVHTSPAAGGLEGGTGITVNFPASEGEGGACGQIVTTAMTSFSSGVVNKALLDSNQPLVVGGPRLLASQTPDTTDQDVTVAVTVNGEPVEVVHTGSAWSASIPAALLATLPNNAEFEIVATFSDGTSATRRIQKDVTPPALSASLTPGTYTGAQRVALASDGGEQVRFTTDGSLPNDVNSDVYRGTELAIDRSQTIRAFSVDAAGNRTDASFAYTIAAPAPPPNPGPAPGPGPGPSPSAGAGAGAGVGTGPAPLVAASRTFALRGMTVARRLSLRRARRSGVRVTLRLVTGTRLVEVRLYRMTGRRGRRVVRVMRTTGNGRTYRFALRSRSLRRGRYQLRVRAGADRSSLGPVTKRTFRIA